MASRDPLRGLFGSLRARVLVLVLASLVPLLNRQSFPPALLPEHWYLGQTMSPQQAEAFNAFFSGMAGRAHENLEGCPVLLLSDSTLFYAPWQVDRIVGLSYSSRHLRTLFSRKIGDRHYEWIVIWSTMVDVLSNRVTHDEIVRSLKDLVETVLPYADHIAVLGPLPVVSERYPNSKRETPSWAQPDVMYLLTMRMAEELASDRVHIVNVQPMYEQATWEGDASHIYLDFMHLNGEGFERLHHLLLIRGVPLEQPVESLRAGIMTRPASPTMVVDEPLQTGPPGSVGVTSGSADSRPSI